MHKRCTAEQGARIDELVSAAEARGSGVNRRAGMRLGSAADLGLGVERGAYALEVAQLLLDCDLVREVVLVLAQLPRARAMPSWGPRAEGRGVRCAGAVRAGVQG